MRHIQRMANMNRTDKRRGQRVLFVRKSVLGLKSARQLAEMLTAGGFPVTRGAVANWEQGKNIGIEALRRISKLSHVDLNWISHEEGEAPVGENGETFAAEHQDHPVSHEKPETMAAQPGSRGDEAPDLAVRLADLFARIMRLNTDQQGQIADLIESRLPSNQEKSRATTTKQVS